MGNSVNWSLFSTLKTLRHSTRDPNLTELPTCFGGLCPVPQRSEAANSLFRLVLPRSSPNNQAAQPFKPKRTVPYGSHNPLPKWGLGLGGCFDLILGPTFATRRAPVSGADFFDPAWLEELGWVRATLNQKHCTSSPCKHPQT